MGMLLMCLALLARAEMGVLDAELLEASRAVEVPGAAASRIRFLMLHHKHSKDRSRLRLAASARRRASRVPSAGWRNLHRSPAPAQALLRTRPAVLRGAGGLQAERRDRDPVRDPSMMLARFFRC